jgi:hypothetical protein
LENCRQVLSSTSSSSLSLFSLCQPCRPHRPFPEPQLPRAALPPRHVPLLHRARHFPASAGPLPTPPRRAATARAAMRAAELASSCFTRAVFLLALKLPQESLLTSFTRSTTPHYLSFLPPLDYSCRSSVATSARRRQPPLPPPTPDPVLQ